MSNWLIAIALSLLIGGVATFYFRTIQMRRDETLAGIAALSGVSWRSFIHMVLDALARRGFGRLVDDENAADDSDYVLERNGEHWLLSCKHGSAFVLGRLTVNELAKAIDLKGAAGGFLLTQGKITDDARPVAALQRIELLDGPALWPQLRDFLPPEQLAGIRAKAARLARQRILSSWLTALLAGVAVFLALPERASPAAAPATAAPAVADVPESTAQQQVAEPAGTAPVTEAPAAPEVAPMDIEQQRGDVAAAISTLPDVDRAVWSSESTLQVFLSTIDGDAFARICPLMERYEDLASSRIQLTPPPGSAATVRFRQCRSY